jgi:hypothetical protein
LAQAATTIWAGTSIEPFKSIDGGATWQLVKVTTSNSLLQDTIHVLANHRRRLNVPDQKAPVPANAEWS